MATILITSAISIGVGLALNALFPAPDINVEGPRLTDLGFSASTYGRFVDISWGTDRHEGNLIDTTDPPIEEVSSTERSSAGKGGGSSIKTTSYQYFHTGRWSFGISGAESVHQLWINKKLAYDASAEGNLLRNGVDFTFYPGGDDQEKDPDEVARHGAAEAQGYRHLTSIVFNRTALADFQNTIQSVSAVIAYNEVALEPFEFMNLPASASPSNGLETTYMQIDPLNDILYSYGSGDSMWSANLSSFTFRSGYDVTPSAFSPATRVSDLQGQTYMCLGSFQTSPFYVLDADTGKQLNAAAEDVDNFSGNYGNLRVTIPGFGVFEVITHTHSQAGPPLGDVYIATKGAVREILDPPTLTYPDGAPLIRPENGFIDVKSSIFVGDHDRNRGYFISDSEDGTAQIMKMTAELSLGLLGATLVFELNEIGTFTHGSAGDDFPSGSPTAWAVDRSTGRLILSNGSEIVLYDPSTDTTLAQRGDVGFHGRHNYFNGADWAFAFSSGSAGFLHYIDTRTLEDIRVTNMNTEITWPSGDGELNDKSHVWDDDRKAIIFTRVGNPDPPDDESIVRLFVGRLGPAPAPLDQIVTDLCTTYEKQEMAGLDATDFDVTPLVGKMVPGLTINNVSTIRDVMDILRRRFFLDVIVSDWIIKFVERGGAPSLTIPAALIGESSTSPDSPPVERTQTDESDEPMRLSIRYRNMDMDYAPDAELYKRQRKPDPLVNTLDEEVLDLSIAETSTNMKNLANEWLWTIVNEGGQIKTRLPWHYLALDPSDVIELTVFDELITVRVGELNNALGWFLDIVGIEEDARSFTGTLTGQLPGGFNRPNLPSGNQTNLLFIDGPLLDMDDLSVDTHSNGYFVFRAFDDSWPSATAYRSPDDLTFEPIASGSQEGAVGKVLTGPSTWARSSDDSFRNVWQEVVDGGTLTFTALRRPAEFTSATELNVYNGANAIAFITTNGVEVIQYQTAVDNADGSITISRLLRGRLGTEDITDAGGPQGGDLCVLLQIGVVAKQKLLINLLNLSLSYRGVTTGTLIEDATTQPFAYTGRDVEPFSVVAATAVAGSPDGLDVTWTRRARGPFGGSISLDPALHETKEEYVARLKDHTGTVIVTKTITTEFVNFSQAELDSAAVASEIATIEITQVSGTGRESQVTPDSIITIGEVDPHFSSVVLLTHLDIDDASKTVLQVDESSLNHSLAYGGGALAVDAVAPKFGARSLFCNNLTDGVIYVDDSTNGLHALGVNDWTIEGWFRWTTAAANNDILIAKWRTSASRLCYRLFWDGAAALLKFEYSTNGSTVTTASSASFTPTLTQQYHIAVTRNGADIKIFVDGVQSGTTFNAGSDSITQSNARFALGGDQDFSGGFDGRIDEVRITNGVARYQGNTTPPTAAFPNG